MKEKDKSKWIVLAISGLLFFTGCLLLILNPNTPELTIVHFAQLGDFIGGIAGSAIAATALLYVVKAYKMQKTELELTRKEFLLQREELKNQNKILERELISKAGILGDAMVGMITEQMMQRVLSVNVAGPIRSLQLASRLMRRNGGGAIVTVSSIIGLRGNPGQVVYGASKAALVGMTLSAAKELAPYGIRVNAVAPGYIDTDMIGHLPDAVHQDRVKNIPMGRVGSPQEVARVIAFLASDEAAYVTGQVLGVDGGMVI